MEEPEIEYKKLSKFEKFAEFKEVGFHGEDERHRACIYLKALWLNDTKTLEYIESFGQTPRHMLMNLNEHEAAKVYGINEYTIDHIDWIVTEKLQDKERIMFETKTNNQNYIEVAKGKNGLWAYGFGCSNNTEGSYSGVDIWAEPSTTREEAIAKAVEYVIQFHTRTNSTISSKVIAQAQELLHPEVKEVQLSLF